MSFEATYDPTNITVPNVVTAWTEVDVPTGKVNTLNNPDTSAVGGVVTPNACKVIVSPKQVIPFTAGDTTAWTAAQAAALLVAEQTEGIADVTSHQAITA